MNTDINTERLYNLQEWLVDYGEVKSTVATGCRCLSCWTWALMERDYPEDRTVYENEDFFKVLDYIPTAIREIKTEANAPVQLELPL